MVLGMYHVAGFQKLNFLDSDFLVTFKTFILSLLFNTEVTELSRWIIECHRLFLKTLSRTGFNMFQHI